MQDWVFRLGHLSNFVGAVHNLRCFYTTTSFVHFGFYSKMVTKSEGWQGRKVQDSAEYFKIAPHEII